jgi:elongator complex protein 2
MTTRIFAPLTMGGYGEVARPQVHGYLVSTVNSITSTRFVSSAEEPILRVFEAPATFVNNFVTVTGMQHSHVFQDDLHLSHAAIQPDLGLSNKAVEVGDNSDTNGVSPQTQYTSGLPTEDILSQDTIWPEIQKLYGHPYIVQSVAVNSAKTLVATACRASSADDAAILMFSLTDWSLACKLFGHRLTVTQLRFSFDDNFLLSVSRDRTWSVFQRNSDGEYVPFATCDQNSKYAFKHSRIIFDGAWSRDSRCFVTAGRDKVLALWQINAASVEYVNNFTASDAITAVDIAPAIKNLDNQLVIVCGMENGSIQILSKCADNSLRSVLRLCDNAAFSSAITAIR